VVIAAAIWLTGSRTALAAAFITAAVTGLAELTWGRHRRAALAIAVILVTAALALWAYYPARRNTNPFRALEIRLALAKGSLAMTADHPWFGAGLGRFYELSEEYLNTHYYVRENAHNNFLQVLAELGVSGLSLFLATIGFALANTFRQRSPCGASWALLAAPATFLLTCFGGHPLVVHHASYPFWMALGLAAASPAEASPAVSPRLRSMAAVAIVVLTATLPWRATAAVRTANLEHTSIGFSQWHRESDGTRYRFTGTRSAFFVPSSARAIRIPLQHGGDGPAVVEIRIFLNGREANRVVLRKEDGWRTMRLLMPGDRVRFSRIDLEAALPDGGVLDARGSNTSGVLKVGRPFVEE
jgi:hypothetical protein